MAPQIIELRSAFLVSHKEQFVGFIRVEVKDITTAQICVSCSWRVVIIYAKHLTSRYPGGTILITWKSNDHRSRKDVTSARMVKELPLEALSITSMVA